MKETELAQHFVKYFKGFDLYFEVFGVDIVVLSGKKRIAIEVKTSFNMKVIEQAFYNKQSYHLSYVAIPRPKGHHPGYTMCRELGIGVLVWEDHEWAGSYVTEKSKPSWNKVPKKTLDSNILKDYMKLSLPGTAGAQEAVTPFKLTVEALERYVKRHPNCTLKQAIEGIKHHYSSFRGAKACIKSYIESGVIKGVGLKDGKMYCKMVRTRKPSLNQ